MESEHYFMLELLTVSYGFFILFILTLASEDRSWEYAMDESTASRNHIRKKASAKRFIWKMFRFNSLLLFAVAELYGVFTGTVHISFILGCALGYLVVTTVTALVLNRYV
jgi:hypothetical protein